MWRNGRRNGLKIRSREKRGMGSNPIIGTLENPIYLGKLVRIRDLVDCEQSRTKTHENTVYLTSIRQVNGPEKFRTVRNKIAHFDNDIVTSYSDVQIPSDVKECFESIDRLLASRESHRVRWKKRL
jgi:hypothetical protein